jgi:hypothetical protein
VQFLRKCEKWQPKTSPYQENPYSSYCDESALAAESDEHIIKCSYCGRNLIVKDNVNNGVAFLSHLKNDHDIFFTPQRMTEAKVKKRADGSQSLASE